MSNRENWIAPIVALILIGGAFLFAVMEQKYLDKHPHPKTEKSDSTLCIGESDPSIPTIIPANLNWKDTVGNNIIKKTPEGFKYVWQVISHYADTVFIPEGKKFIKIGETVYEIKVTKEVSLKRIK